MGNWDLFTEEILRLESGTETINVHIIVNDGDNFYVEDVPRFLLRRGKTQIMFFVNFLSLFTYILL